MTRPSPRFRRLRADHEALQKLKAESSILDFVAHGEPPDRYLIKFHGHGLYRPEGTSRVAVASEHHVSVTLGASYPRLMPELHWKTPLFHPNVSGSGVVCLGGYGTYWVPALNLDELCEMLWDMIRYANFDVGSPYNRDAANWARLQTDFRFPLDNRPIRDRIASGQIDVRDGAAKVNHTRVGSTPPTNHCVQDDILFIDEGSGILDAEIIDGDDTDMLVIE